MQIAEHHVTKITTKVDNSGSTLWRSVFIHTDEGMQEITLFAKDGKKSTLNIRKA